MTYSQATAGQIVELYPTRREHPAVLVGAGAVGAWFLSRHHHPIVWLGLGALAFGVAELVVVAWWAVLTAVVIVTAARAHGHAWSAGRYFATFGAWLGALALTIAGGAIAGLGGALVALAASWALWHCAIRPRAHSLSTRTAEHQSNPSAVNR